MNRDYPFMIGNMVPKYKFTTSAMVLVILLLLNVDTQTSFFVAIVCELTFGLVISLYEGMTLFLLNKNEYLWITNIMLFGMAQMKDLFFRPGLHKLYPIFNIAGYWMEYFGVLHYWPTFILLLFGSLLYEPSIIIMAEDEPDSDTDEMEDDDCVE